MSITLAKSILGGRWMIDRTWTKNQMGLIAQVLQGGVWGNIPRTGSEGGEQPFFMDATTLDRLDMYINTWDGRIPNPKIAEAKNLTAIIPISGPMLKYNGECGEPGYVQRTGLVLGISRMKNVSSAIFIFDTPGGMVDGLHSFSNAIANMPQHTVAFIDDGMCCSAGMYLAVHCNEIVSSKASDTVGSIGTLATYASLEGYYEKLGVKIVTVYAPQSTEKGESYTELMKNDNPEPLKAELAVVCQEFIDLVAARRPKAAKNAERWNRGASLFAKEAIKIGLVDRIDSLENTIKKAAKSASLTNTKTRTMETNTPSTQMNNMLTAAKADAFAVVAEGDAAPAAGFLLSEEHVNNVAAAMDALQATANDLGTQATAAAEQVTALTAEVAALTATGAELAVANGNQATQIAALNAEKETLAATIAELGSKSSGNGSVITAAAGAEAEAGATGKPSWYVNDGSEEKLNRATKNIVAPI